MNHSVELAYAQLRSLARFCDRRAEMYGSIEIQRDGRTDEERAEAERTWASIEQSMRDFPDDPSNQLSRLDFPRVAFDPTPVSWRAVLDMLDPAIELLDGEVAA